MIYIFGHPKSEHREEFRDKEAFLYYLRHQLPNENDFRYRTTYTCQDAERIIFSFSGEMVADVSVGQIVLPIEDDIWRYDKVKTVYLITEIRLFKKKSFRWKDFAIKPCRSGRNIGESQFRTIIEAVGGFEQQIRQP